MATRQLVVLCDGTWNDPASNTNVWLIYKAFAATLQRATQTKYPPDRRVATGVGPSGNPVVIYYDNGVGTAKDEKLTGGAMGIGLSENVMQAYEFLARTYQDGDEIHLFGFSRGAFTVRSLCGFLRAAGGLLPVATEAMGSGPSADLAEALSPGIGASFAKAYDFYRTPPKKRTEAAKDEIRRLGPRPVTIRTLGVYDTVGALGVPIPAFAFFQKLFPKLTRFHDTTLSDIVENAFHALAIDEQRGPFVPALWMATPGSWRTEGKSGPQRVLQVWFAGAHADVGGGYEERQLADIPLDWMMRRAIECGLDLPDSALPIITPWCAIAERHDSFRAWRFIHKTQERSASAASQSLGPVLNGLWFGSVLDYFRAFRTVLRWLKLDPAVRSIGSEQSDDIRLGFAVGEMLHESVEARRRRGYASRVLRKANLEAVPLFRERQTLRRPAVDAVTIGAAAATLVDRSAGGIQAEVTGVVPAKDSVVALAGAGLPAQGRVAWTRGNRVGLAFAA